MNCNGLNEVDVNFSLPSPCLQGRTSEGGMRASYTSGSQTAHSCHGSLVLMVHSTPMLNRQRKKEVIKEKVDFQEPPCITLCLSHWLNWVI